MYKQSINFTTNPLVIKTKKVLPHHILMQISEFVQFVKYDFNVDIHNSSAYLFNKSPVGTLTLTNEEFIFFLEKNIEFAEKTTKQFNPFYIDGPFDYNIELGDVIDIDTEDVAFVKQIEIYFDTKPLMEAFVVDTTHDLLLKNGVSEFMIETRHFTRVEGKTIWDVKYQLEDNKNYVTKMKTGTIYFHYMSSKKDTIVKAFNVDPSTFINARILVIESSNAVKARIISALAAHLQSKKQFEDFAFKNRIRIVAYDQDSKSHIFNYA